MTNGSRSYLTKHEGIKPTQDKRPKQRSRITTSNRIKSKEVRFKDLDSGSSEIGLPCLKGVVILHGASRFRRYINRKRENRKWLNKALDEGPYQFQMFVPSDSTVPKLQTVEDLQGDALLHYDAELDMWKRVNVLMGKNYQKPVERRKTCFTNEFDQFVAEPREALISVYNHFAQLMNDLERNNMHFPIVTINTKFLNSLQPEWLKYVTQVRLAKCLTVDTFDDLFDYLRQFEKLVNASRAKKLEKSHDPLALDDVKTNSEDPFASAMLLLARAITQNFSNPTNNRLHTSSNTRKQAIIQGDRVNIQSRNPGNTGRNTRRAYVQEEVVEGINTQMRQNVHKDSSTLSFRELLNCLCYNVVDREFARNCPGHGSGFENSWKQMLLAKPDELDYSLPIFIMVFLYADCFKDEKLKNSVQTYA
ncbi:hypothetical protein Tco_0097896 [Tanacetum coccineum]